MATDSACDEMTRLAWSGGVPTPSSRLVAQEAAIALTYNGSTFAVMMASPSDLRDFGIGFTITEGIAERAEELRGIDLIESDLGVEIRMWLDEERIGSVHARRRAIMGPVGCGLCGIESLEQAVEILVASPDPWLRSCGAYAIGTLRINSLAEELNRCMNDSDPLLRETARTAKLRLQGITMKD